METFKAFVVNKDENAFSKEIKVVDLNFLQQRDVLIKVAYSSVNYKDGLASLPESTVVTSYPIIPGIDLAGTVVQSADERFKEGDEVIATSYEIGTGIHGGYSEYAKIPAEWIVPLPKNISLKESMIIGTAGFTAALSIDLLEKSGLKPASGTVLVTGATGGVGSIAVMMLHKLGYDVIASTGKESQHEYLREIGATEILSRASLQPERIRPLDKQRWAGAVDPVGGDILAYVLSATKYGGAVAVSGLTNGPKVATTVFPFILRGVKLLGVDSVNLPMDERLHIWNRIASDLKLDQTLLEKITTEITLDELPQTLDTILQGKITGRTIVKL